MKSTKIKYLIGLALMSILILNGCYYDQNLPDTGENLGEISFSEDLMVIFNTSCNSTACHGGTSAPDLRLERAYNELINGNYINTSNPENSELIQWMQGNRGLAMPLSGPNATYNAKVLAWIRQGALNN
ncbi:hypothetical protein [Belliella aquatica]|uniref:Cytochrome c domain-containing protein n=1 Tax=Belliella aquatica TaxID=1323734 RepID=A0ABQ1M7P0_9BACT|nr:hypothetical protein [Belliella aquatica]MCH7404737.1 hypothetical protein [Belliella aquatica]GGC34493.1 hypothetical protein GCM10010993_11790 [Belliella aquatica]